MTFHTKLRWYLRRGKKSLGAAVGILIWLHIGVVQADELNSFAANPDLPDADVRSGISFLTEETQSLQRDEFDNPGLLWVERGEQLFRAGEANASCASCHAPREPKKSIHTLVGAATKYPAYNAASEQLVNLEARINSCVTTQQHQPKLKYESEALLSLTAYVASLSKGMRYAVAVDGPAASFFQSGRDYFFRRKGQLNLACSQCHDDNWGRMLRGDQISQGHGNAFPVYRFQWQSMGSLHRRISDCDVSINAEPHLLGSQEYTAVELYLAWRAKHLPLESPGVRR